MFDAFTKFSKPILYFYKANELHVFNNFIQVLDTRDLTINNVTNETGEVLKHSLGEVHQAFGKPLIIDLPDGLKRC